MECVQTEEKDFIDKEGTTSGFGFRPFSEAWIKYILEFSMPDVVDTNDEKNKIIQILKPIMNVSARGNLDNRDISNLLWQYDNLWQAYIVYHRHGRRDPDLISLKRGLRAAYFNELTRSKKMGQMNMIFQPKQNIFQRILQSGNKSGFFRSKENIGEDQE